MIPTGTVFLTFESPAMPEWATVLQQTPDYLCADYSVSGLFMHDFFLHKLRHV
jgi:hypothetical protein